MKLNLEYYRTFFAAANFLSFTQAANHLFLTQSAVSQSVKKLEQELGCLLFDRSPQGLKLTTEGEILYRHVREAFEELQNGEWELKKLASFQDGELKIGATETSLHILLGPVMKQFKKKFPQIHVTFTGSTTSDTCRHLTDGAIEIAFLISPLPPNVHFQLTEIMEIQDVFIASSHFPIDFDKTYT
ncbi:MAG: LysR family transcriptional regulator, partial [Lachnospiraceae bacterium]|nr:LysR family transcriptional regulator [Lachnospiraceae bacterium]